MESYHYIRHACRFLSKGLVVQVYRIYSKGSRVFRSAGVQDIQFSVQECRCTGHTVKGLACPRVQVYRIYSKGSRADLGIVWAAYSNYL